MSTDTSRAFDQFCEDGTEPQTAALLAIAYSIERLAKNLEVFSCDSLSHEICMGIRKGLFGSGATDTSSISQPLYGITEALEDLLPGASQ